MARLPMGRIARYWHDFYAEKLTTAEKNAIDEAYDAAVQSLRRAGFAVKGDDRAEKLVAALTQYLEECTE